MSVEAERGGDHAVEGLDLGVIPVEQGQEAGLGAGRPLDAQEPELGASTLDFPEVEDQLVAPERRPLAHGHELGRLEVGVAQAGKVLPPDGEVREGVDRRDEPVADQVKGFSDQDQVGVVGHVTTRRAQVDDRAGRRRRIPQRVDVGHHVVAEPPLVGFGGGEVDRLDLGAERVDLLVADVQPQRALGLGQRDPEPAPRGELDPGRPEPGHPPAGVAGDQGIVVNVVITHQRMLADLSFSFDIQED